MLKIWNAESALYILQCCVLRLFLVRNCILMERTSKAFTLTGLNLNLTYPLSNTWNHMYLEPGSKNPELHVSDVATETHIPRPELFNILFSTRSHITIKLQLFYCYFDINLIFIKHNYRNTSVVSFWTNYFKNTVKQECQTGKCRYALSAINTQLCGFCYENRLTEL